MTHAQHSAPGFPKDSSITDLRISLVFRHCDRNWVKPGQYYYRVDARGRPGEKKCIDTGAQSVLEASSAGGAQQSGSGEAQPAANEEVII